VSIIELPTPITNIALVNQQMLIQTPIKAFAKQTLKEKKIAVILKHLQEWR